MNARPARQRVPRAVRLGIVGRTVGGMLLLWGIYVTLARIGGPAAQALLGRALADAGLPALTPDAVFALVLAPQSWLPAVAALVLAVAGALFWTAAVFAVAADPSHRPIQGLRNVLPRIRRWGWRRSVVLIVPVAFLSPLLGIPLFAPVTRDNTIPPFIGREFLKTPHSGALWVLLLAALGVIVVACIITLTRDRHRPAHPRRWLRDYWRVGLGVAVIALIARIVPQVAGIVSDALAVVAAVLTALAISGRLRASVDRGATSRIPAITAFASVAVLATGASAVGPLAAADGHEPGREDAVVIAHRGYDSAGPENTISALEAAALHDPDFVEVDLIQTADGGIVASHDVNLAVLAGVPRNITEMTTEEVTSTVIEMHGNRDTIPTMAEYVQRAKELGVPLLIELKLTGSEQGNFAAQVVEELTKIDGLEGNSFHSLDVATVQHLEGEHPELDVGLTIAMIQGDLPAVDCDFFVIEQSSITPDMVDAAHARGVPLYAWTVNDEHAMRDLLAIGVGGIVTDNLEADALDGL